jgi:hypothetical protein
MASVIDICNIALNHLGNPGRVSSISPPDGTTEASVCATYYPIALRELLESADWSFARKRTALALLTVNPSAVWGFAYAMPSDCVTPQRVLTGGTQEYDLDSAQFDIEGAAILSNKADAVLAYTHYVDDANSLPQVFVNALTYLLAAMLAGAILRGGEGAKTAIDLRKLAARMQNTALAADANKGDTKVSQLPSIFAARAGLVGGTQPTQGYQLFGSGYGIN